MLSLTVLGFSVEEKLKVISPPVWRELERVRDFKEVGE
jgi:hypothetical protein